MTLQDPMLHAASEALREHPDHLRWLGYADAEMARLRGLLDLTCTGYAAGEAQYTAPPALRLTEQTNVDIAGVIDALERVLAGLDDARKRLGLRFSYEDAVRSVLADSGAVGRLRDLIALPYTDGELGAESVGVPAVTVSGELMRCTLQRGAQSEDRTLSSWVDNDGRLRVALPVADPKHSADVLQLIIDPAAVLSTIGAALATASAR